MTGIQKALRQGWLADLVAIALCSTMFAHLATTIFDRAPPPPPALVVRGRPAPVPAKVPPIIARNIFCSACREGAPPRPERTLLPLTVVAILYAPPPLEARASLAVVRDDELRAYRIVGVGDHLRGATVVDVAPTRLQVSRGARAELLDLLAAPAAPSLPPSTFDRGIQQLGDGSYEIARSTLDAVLADTPALLQAARILPELHEGRSAGFRLLSLRPDGVFARIGLRNGDVVVAVNGLPLTSPETALDAFVKLRSATHISLALERNTHRLTHEYRIR